jgi:two-component system chemotaxis response regulator CheY
MQRLILVVDDTAYAREAMALALMSIHDVDVRTAGSMLEAMRIVDSIEGIDALCTDLNMPFGDGFQLIEQVRSDIRYSRIPIVVISANTDEATPERVKSLGADAFFSKPYSPLVLRQTLEQLFNAKQNPGA